MHGNISDVNKFFNKRNWHGGELILKVEDNTCFETTSVRKQQKKNALTCLYGLD